MYFRMASTRKTRARDTGSNATKRKVYDCGMIRGHPGYVLVIIHWPVALMSMQVLTSKPPLEGHVTEGLEHQPVYAPLSARLIREVRRRQIDFSFAFA